MNRKSIAQTFTNGSSTSKVALLLRPVEPSPSSAMSVSASTDLVVDAANYTTFSGSSIFYDDGTSFTGSGYIRLTNGRLNYPIKPSDDGTYKLYVRYRKRTGTTTFTVYVDGQSCYTTNNVDGGFVYSDTYLWIQLSVTFPDTSEHIIGVKTAEATDIDKIVITKSTVPTSTGPAYTDSSYATCHVRSMTLVSGTPTTTLGYDALSTYLSIRQPDWYNFALSGTTAGTNAIVLNVSGTSAIRSVVWDVADSVTVASKSSTNGAAWVTDSLNSMSLKVYSNDPSLTTVDGEQVLVTPDAVIVTNTTNDFDETISPHFDNTSTVADSESGNDVVLNTEEKLVSLLIDQSGSNTWNDPNNARIVLAKDIVTTLQDRYPSDVRFNLLSFNGERSFSVFVPLKTQIKSNDISEIVAAHFADNSYDFAGFRLLRKEGSYSTTPIDGEIVKDGYALAGLDTGLSPGTKYYYTVYTYDQLSRFSEGIQLSVIAETRTVPRGIPSFDSAVHIGHGPLIDDNTVALWHMDEGSGDHVFDFSKSAAKLSLTSVRWLDLKDSPIGLYGLRFNGNSSRAASEANAFLPFGSATPFTFLFHVYPLDTTTEACIIARSDATHFGWGVEMQAGGVLRLRIGTSTRSGGNALVANQWNACAIRYDGAGAATFTVNGATTAALSFAAVNGTLTALPMNVGHDPSGTFANTFFGKFTHLSVHDTFRDDSYVTSALSDSKDDRANSADNGDRVVVLRWNIPEDFDFVGGNYRLVVNRQHAPSHENDGTILIQDDAFSGSYAFNASGEYDLGHVYYFRLFSQNTIGNWSAIDDSAVLAVSIPALGLAKVSIDLPDGSVIDEEVGPGFGPFAVPMITDVRAGNEKIWLQWEVPDDSRISRVIVYYSPEGFPYYDGKTKSIIGNVIFNEPKSIAQFVHRKIPNQQVAYYAIVTVDKYNRFSTLELASETPLQQLDDSGIPLLEVSNVRYYINDYDRIEIRWDSPVKFNTSLDAYFDETFYLYGAICDLYGNPLPIDFPDNFAITAEVKETTSSGVEDAFNIGAVLSNVNQLPRASFAVSGGLIVGKVSLKSNSALAILEQLTIGVKAIYSYSDNFTYTLPPLSVSFNNPIALTLINRDSDFLSVSVFGSDCEADAFSGPPNQGQHRKAVHGCYVRRKKSVAIRAEYTYKGEPITHPNLSYAIFDDKTKDSIHVNPCSLTPDLTRQSTSVVLTSKNLSTAVEVLPIFDNFGNPTVYTNSVSFTDMLMVPPYLPQSAALFFLVSHNGSLMIRKINVSFANILKLDLTGAAPRPDSLDIREEFSRVYIIDPDSPNDETKITRVPDLTVVKWRLTVGINGDTSVTNVPFYSIDNVPLGNGVYSYTRNGTARQVFFGPASNAAAGEYTLSASTTYKGLFADSKAVLEIEGLTGSVFDTPIPNPTAPTIFCEFEHAVETIYADGEEFIKMWIWRDGNNATAVGTLPNDTAAFKTSYLSCNVTTVPLKIGQVVHVEAGGWEIIYGASEVISGGNTTLDVSSAVIGLGTLDVKLSKNAFTNVYFRINKQIDNSLCSGIIVSNACGCPIPDTICGEEEIALVSTKINFSGKPLIIYGGGAIVQGKPPTVMSALEPLAFDFVGVYVDGAISNSIVIDGITENTIVGEMTWKGGTVPDGTPVTVKLVSSKNALGKGLDNLITLPATIYTEATNDPLINPTGNTRSFVRLTLPPIPTTLSFVAGIAFSATYNAVGTVARLKQFGIKFSYVIRKPLVAGPPAKAIDNGLQRYNVIGGTWTTLKGMTHSRASFGFQCIGNKLYAISGTDGSQLLSSVEEYDIAANIWTAKANITTPRIYAQCVQLSGLIYMIGGMVADGEGNLSISTSVQRFNPTGNVWTTLTSMPNGVMLGTAQVVGTKIYVLSGYKDELFTFNDTALVYDTVANTWSIGATFTSTALELSKRLGAFSFIKGTDIVVTDGLFYLPPIGLGVDATPGVIIYRADSYKYSTTGATLTTAQQTFQDLPIARYNGATVTISNVDYFIGGSNDESQTLRYFESVDTTSSPYTYASLTKLQKGRNSFGAAAHTSDSTIYVAGGITSGRAANFLKLDTDVVPKNAGLNGYQTIAVNIYVADENGDSPALVNVRVVGTAGQGNPVLFSEDNISVIDGFAVATLLPRSDDPPTAQMGEGGVPTKYSVNVGGSILDDQFFGETEEVSTEPEGGGFIDPNESVPDIFFAVVPTYTFPTIVRKDFTSEGAIVKFANIGGFIDLNPAQSFHGSSSNVLYTGQDNWLPQVVSWIDDDQGNYEDVLDFLDRIDKEVPFGGTPMLDALDDTVTIVSLDDTDVGKKVVVFGDGLENVSNQTEATVLAHLNAAGLPVVAAITKIVPSTMHLDKGERGSAPVIETIATETEGSVELVTNDIDLETAVARVLSAKGFIGDGEYDCIIDLGESVLIESIQPLYELTDPDANASWQFALSGDSLTFTEYSDLQQHGTTLTLTDAAARYVKFRTFLKAFLKPNEYGFGKLVPPKLTKILIRYHQKTVSYLYLNSLTTDDEVSQIVVTIDADRPKGTEIAVGVSSYAGASFDDYFSAEQPAVENDTKIIVPLRRPLSADTYATLEALKSVDGFIFSSTYGKWPLDALVAIYENGTDLIDDSEYRAFPQEGYVVFNSKTTGSFALMITPQPSLVVAAKITNRIQGNPLVIHGVGYMYTTLEQVGTRTTGNKIAPQAVDLLLAPLEPTVDSIFTAIYSFYDLSGRAESGTKILWYINGKVQPDLEDLKTWDNAFFDAAKLGDAIYFSVKPSNGLFTGATVRSLPVTVTA